jgi:hypothetical protein
VTGTVVITRQVIVFEDGDLLITQGPELAETDVAIVRAVTGGTGDFADAPAEIHQTLLGMSEGYGVRLQMEFAEETARNAHQPDDLTFAERNAGLDAIDHGHRGR